MRIFMPSLGHDYDGKTIRPPEWMISEKLDGCRCLWNGKELISRQGRKIQCPDWFIQPLLDKPRMDGELYGGQGMLQYVNGMLQRKKYIDIEWQAVKYWIFDTPDHPGNFIERQIMLTKALKDMPDWIKHQTQSNADSEEFIERFFQQVLDKGGEGAILRKIEDGGYQQGRTYTFLKIKP